MTIKSNERQLFAEAYEAICEAVLWIDPHPPAESKPEEALHVLEDWLIKYHKSRESEVTQDDDTEGDPIGWKIVATGNDGSVLCEKENGRRARFWFTNKKDADSQ